MIRKVLLVPTAIVTSAGLAVAGVLAHSGTFGLSIILRHVIPVWVTIEPNDQRLSASMRLALQDKPPVARPGPFKWQQLDRGFDVGELSVMADNVEVDRILLARIDPDRFKFQVRNRSSDSWDGSDKAVIILMALMHACVELAASVVCVRPLLFLRENIFERVRQIDNEFARLEMTCCEQLSQ